MRDARGSASRDLQELVENGYVQGMSFAMAQAPEYFATIEGGKRIANAKSFIVSEVTVTACPAFSETSVSVLDDTEEAEEVGPQELSDANRLEAVTLERLKLKFMRV